MNPFQHGWRNPAVMFGGGGGGSVAQPVGTSVTTTSSNPWEGQQPYLNQAFQQAEALRSTGGPSYYPNATYVPQSGQTSDALAAAENRARTGSPLQAAGNQQMLDTIQGKFLDPSSNPWLEETYKRAADPMVRAYRDAVSPGTDAKFLGAGRLQSGLYANMKSNQEQDLLRGLGDLGTSIYGGAYESERGRQQEAVGAAPQYAQADYMDADRLANVGQTQESYAYSKLQDDMNRFNYEQQRPWTNLANYKSIIDGSYGRTDTMSQPIYRQPSNTLGTVMGGLGGLGMLAGGLAPFFSSEKLKDKGEAVDVESMPEKVAGLGMSKWNYKGDNQTHMGPMAEDFAAKMGVGDGMTISPVDMYGALMAANQGLTKRLQRLEASAPWQSFSMGSV